MMPLPLVVVLSVALTTAGVNAAVLCAKPKKDGTFSASVKVREACKAGEASLDPALLGLQGPKGEKGDAGEPGPPGPALIARDSNGTVVGVVLDSNVPCDGCPTYSPPRVRVGREANGVAVSLLLDGGGFVGTFHPLELFYESDDCTGQPFGTPTYPVGFYERPLVPQAVPDAPRVRAYFQADDAAEVMLYRSHAGLFVDGLQCGALGGVFRPPNLCCVLGNTVAQLPRVESIDISTFVPPIRVGFGGG